MKPFDLKAALSGEPIQYRDLCTCTFLRLSTNTLGQKTMWFCLVGDERKADHLETTLDGDVTCVLDGGITRVVMAPKKVKRTVYVNLASQYQSSAHGFAHIFDTPEAAKHDTRYGKDMAIAVPVIIEVTE